VLGVALAAGSATGATADRLVANSGSPTLDPHQVSGNWRIGS
jgi:hypothetical protein